MEELALGPNGALIYAIEFLMSNQDWLREQLGDFVDDYLIIDCPGQIELYTHAPVMRRFVDVLRDLGYSVCALYLVDSQYLVDGCKFISSTLTALSAMIHLELPHLNVISKMDICPVKVGGFFVCGFGFSLTWFFFVCVFF